MVKRFWRRFLPDLVQKVDLTIFRRISEIHHPAGDRLLPRLSRAANHSRLWTAIAAIISLLDGRRGRRAGLRGMLSVGLASFVVNVPAKLTFNRMRPTLQVPVARRLARLPASTSFPSGHSASAFAFATGVSLERPALAPLIYPLASAVAYSRIYTGVHYPTDVVVGAGIGVGAAFAARRLWRAVSQGHARTASTTGASVTEMAEGGDSSSASLSHRR